VSRAWSGGAGACWSPGGRRRRRRPWRGRRCFGLGGVFFWGVGGWGGVEVFESLEKERARLSSFRMEKREREEAPSPFSPCATLPLCKSEQLRTQLSRRSLTRAARKKGAAAAAVARGQGACQFSLVSSPLTWTPAARRRRRRPRSAWSSGFVGALPSVLSVCAWVYSLRFFIDS